MKKLEGFEQIGFSTDKEHKVAYGMIDGLKYLVNFLPNQRQYSIILTVLADSEESLSAYVKTLEQNEIVNWTFYRDQTIVINIKNTKQLSVNDLEKLMKDLSAFCHANGYVQACPHCKEEKAVDVCNISGENVLMCPECFEKYVSNQPTEKTANVPMGVLGALVGSLIGVVVWVLIYKLGYVAGITGFVMSVCCFKGYELLGGRIDRKGVYISIVIAVIMLAFAEMVALGLEIHSTLNDYYSITIPEAFSMIPVLLGENEVILSVVKDLLSGYLLMGVASFSYIKNIHQIAKTDGVNVKIG